MRSFLSPPSVSKGSVMYSIVKIGGHQFRVEPGTIIDVQKLEGDEGKTLTLEDVLFVGGKDVLTGTPLVKGAKVSAKIVRQARSRKEIVFVRKRGLYQKKKGHRQHYTSLLITEINDGAGNTEAFKEKKAAKKTTTKKEAK